MPDLFAALAEQTADAGSWSLCLLLDGCTDASRATAERFKREASFRVAIRSIASAAPNAGRARAAAMRMAVRRAKGAAALFLTTDADSTPSPDWIARARASLATCDLAAGRLVRTDRAPSQDRLEHYYDRLYSLRRRVDAVPWEPAPHHHFTSGANMAFRSEAYDKLGGFAARASGEDALIVDEAQRAGLRVRRDPRMVVTTSSRRTGRAPDGLAAALRENRRTEELLVAHPRAMAWQYAAHAFARAIFLRPSQESFTRLASRLSLPIEHVRQLAVECHNAESFAIRVTPSPPDRRLVSLPEAEAALATIERGVLLGCAA